MNRLIPKDSIPDSLWSSEDSILHLPSQLVLSWKMLLDKYGLRAKASECAPDGFEGGMSKEDTDNHLCWRFTGSSARVMLAILDPNGDLAQIPDVFTRIFSGNKVFLADLPCGSGAASMSVLTVFCELRKQGKIPRMPLHIVIVGGEISKYAQHYANEAIESLLTELEAQAITVEFEIMDWDVCDPQSNTDLVKHLTLRSQSCTPKLLMFANCSGFLQRDGKWNQANRQLQELFRHSREENSSALWIEPNNKSNITAFIPRLVTWLKRFLPSFVFGIDKDGEQRDYTASFVKVKHPLDEGTFRVNLVVVQFDLSLRRKP